MSNLTDAINAVSGTTGISAVGTGDSIVLTQADGKNITVADATNTAAGGDFDLSSMDDGDAKEDTITIDVNDTGADDSGTITGFVTFLDDSDFSVKSSIAETAGGIVEETGGAGTVVTGSQTLLSAVSLTSGCHATAALDTIDAALDSALILSVRLWVLFRTVLSRLLPICRQLALTLLLPDRVFRMLILLRRLLH